MLAVVVLIFIVVFYCLLGKKKCKLVRAIDKYTPDSSAVASHNYSQKIPKTIVQTNEKKIIPENMHKANASIIQMNPEYSYIYMDDSDALNFIRKNFNIRVLNAYNKIKPGAFKADLFRYCWLYKNGGVYIDTGFVARAPLKDFISPEDEFVSSEDDGHTWVYNAFIACVPEHLLMKEAIYSAVKNIENEYYGERSLDITGPGLLGKVFSRIVGDKPRPNKKYENGISLLCFKHNNNYGGGEVSLNGVVLFSTKYPEYYDDQSSYNTKLHYNTLWKLGDVY